MLRVLLEQIVRRRAHPPAAQRHDFYRHESLVAAIGEKSRALRASGYLDYPALVHLETITACNAACNFCPYPATARKGNRMADALIEKVIGDLGRIPRTLSFQIAPYKLSDPFLETRLFDIIGLVASRLPGARVSLISNGSAITEKKMALLANCANIAYLNVSLNYCYADEYQSVMQIPFERTVRRLEQLHEREQAGAFAFPIRLTRVASSNSSDREWLEWCRERFPLFTPAILPRNDWIGDAVTPEADSRVPDVSCHRWFDISIISTGEVAMCCMDGDAKYPKGNVHTQHVLDIYNQPRLRRLRESLLSRLQAGDPCARCTYLSY